jgi:nucleoside-diphosphate-sugar epimerase/phosphohistidine swiveling domain-containing protein
MRVVVTGASGGVGSCVVAELVRRGHDVHGLSRGPQSVLPERCRYTRADVRDADALVRVMTDGGEPADAVVHLAWATRPSRDAGATHAVDVGGTRAVVGATQRAGVTRLVVMSSVLAYGANVDTAERSMVESDPLRPSSIHPYSRYKACAEELVETSGVNAVLVRAATVLGRHSTGVTRQRFAAPFLVGVKGTHNLLQFIHPDDLGRFVADAVLRPDWTGPVNLAASDVITLREVATILDKPYVELHPRRVEALLRLLWNRRPFSGDLGAAEAALHSPLVDTTRLGELGFQPAWSSRDCVTDFRRANRENIHLGSTRVTVPWRLPWSRVPRAAPHGPQRRSAHSGAGGEFDSTVDPAWPVYTAANTSEAFPGPMTPLSLELALEAGRATGAQSADILQMTGEGRRVLIEEQTGSFGHAIYLNLSVLFAASAVLPGADPSAWRDLLFGAGSGTELPKFDKSGLWDTARRLPRMVTLIMAAARETRRMNDEARGQQRGAAYYRGLSDQQLHSQLCCTGDEVASAWAMAGLASLAVVPIIGIVEKQAGKRLATLFRGGTQNLVSAGLILSTHELAAQAGSDASIAAILHDHDDDPDGALRRLGAEHPGFTSRLRAVIAEYGHRGPGETELINPVFADSPARLLDVVAKLAGSEKRTVAPMPPMGPRLRLLARLCAGFQQSREQARDAAIRYTHCYRLIAREVGARLAERGVIEHRDEVFYLTRDELMHPPADARDRVARRQAERARLAGQRRPMNFVEHWQPSADTLTEMAPGESLTGTPVSAGTGKGPVRVLTADSTNELQPGEVLVTEFTDTGWTPFFSYAAAVVVDTGAEMSHAAVVAREFGIPCVVGSTVGSRILRTGHIVEVDGSSGRVTRVE